jgi:hypothetical protein
VRVKLGPADGSSVAVVSGDLKEGDRLVTSIVGGSGKAAAAAPPGFGGGGGKGGPRF